MINRSKHRSYGLRPPHRLAFLAGLVALFLLLALARGAAAQSDPTLTIIKQTNPAGGTDFPFILNTVLFERTWGTFGSGANQFNFPSGVALSTTGNVTVADNTNHRILQFNNSGVFLRAWGWDVVTGGSTGFEICTVAANCKAGVAGGGAGQFASPQGVGVDAAGNVTVADTGANHIQQFSSNGTFLRMWGWNVDSAGGEGFEICTVAANCNPGVTGGGAGQFNSPTGVAVDAAGNVTVADLGNHSVQQFSSSLTFLRAWGRDVVVGGSTGFEICTVVANCKTGVGGGGAGQFFNPIGVAIGGTGDVFVADLSNQRIQRFDSNGNFLRMWGRDVVTGGGTGFEVCTVGMSCKAGVGGSGAGQFNALLSVAVDAVGNVTATERDNHRIQQFDSRGNFLRMWGGMLLLVVAPHSRSAPSPPTVKVVSTAAGPGSSTVHKA